MKLMVKLLSSVLVIALMFSLASCASSKKKVDEVVDNKGVQLELYGSSDDLKAGDLHTIFFDFDSASITEGSKEVLTKNADFLKANTTLKIQVEGHCDERGSIQYNLALGERRAKAVQEQLIALGVDAARVTTISYGKERPVAFGHDEESWSKNRRGNFVITEK